MPKGKWTVGVGSPEAELAYSPRVGKTPLAGCFYLIGYVDNVSKVKILGGSNAVYLL